MRRLIGVKNNTPGSYSIPVKANGVFRPSTSILIKPTSAEIAMITGTQHVDSRGVLLCQ